MNDGSNVGAGIKPLGGANDIRTRLIEEVSRARMLIGTIDDLTFRKRSRNTGSVGQQFRHSLDVLNTLLKGIGIGRIDYARRERDKRVEQDRSFAAGAFMNAIARLRSLRAGDLLGNVSVRSEACPQAWMMSSVIREMEFVLSHTIHHHGLISEKLSSHGFYIADDLGVAPSTAEFRRRLAA